jgi:hypothetical protein
MAAPALRNKHVLKLPPSLRRSQMRTSIHDIVSKCNTIKHGSAEQQHPAEFAPPNQVRPGANQITPEFGWKAALVIDPLGSRDSTSHDSAGTLPPLV